LSKLYNEVQKQVSHVTQEGYTPLILCSPTVRRIFKTVVDRVAPRLSVISYQEIVPEVEVHSLGVVGVE